MEAMLRAKRWCFLRNRMLDLLNDGISGNGLEKFLLRSVYRVRESDSEKECEEERYL